VRSVQAAGRAVDPADLPPGLEWERPVWDLYARLQSQWRYAGMSGVRTGLDYGPAIEVMRAQGWDVALGIDLLSAIEHECLTWDAHEREREQPRRH